MIAAISGRGEWCFQLHEGMVNSSVFVDFLKALVSDYGDRPIDLILDNHPSHRSSLVQAYVNEQKGQLQLFYLPSYSPELNPAEQIWKHVKADAGKQFIDSKEILKSTLRLAFKDLKEALGKITSFFSLLSAAMPISRFRK